MTDKLILQVKYIQFQMNLQHLLPTVFDVKAYILLALSLNVALLCLTITMAEKEEIAKDTDFPFLNDPDTIKFIKRSYVMFIVRGLPGSGKSHLANEIVKIYNNSVVCSADTFRPPDLKYPFPKDILVKSHNRCQEAVEEAAKDRTNVIVVDNSNLKLWELKPYLMIAIQYNYTEVLVEPKTQWKWNPVELAARSTQGVPKDVILEKLKVLEQIYPYFYAWFVNVHDSLSMRQVAEKMYGECLEQEKFTQEFKKYAVPDAPRFENGSLDLKHYFSSADFDVGPVMLHCTAFYSDQGKREGSKEYANRTAVEHGLGKSFKMEIIGLLITPRSFGYRLKLDKDEILLWNNDDKNETVNSELHKKMEQMTLTSGDEKQCPGWKPSKFSPTCGPGSRAHLSIGTGVGFKAVQTGLDLVQLIQDELSAVNKTDLLTIDIKSGIARCYGEGNWMVYLDKPMYVGTLFSGYY